MSSHLSGSDSVFSWRAEPSSLTASALTTSGATLAGLRLGVKDLFHIAGVPTAAGNPDWLQSHAIPDNTSPAVAQLLSAGAQLLGKTQTDELAYSLNGLNIHYGAPVNPVAPERLPGGSSSGSAVAVAAGAIDIGLGTDTGGSIRVPASYNGLFGIRTSHGAISCEYMVPLAPLFDTVGWLARDAQTLRVVGDVLLPPSDKLFSPKQVRVALLLPEINSVPLWTPLHQQWLTQQPLLQVFKPLFIKQDWLARASECFRMLQGFAIWQTHGEWITQTQPHFAPDIHARFAWCATITTAQQAQAQAEREQLRTNIAEWFDQVDIVVMPTTPGPSPLLGASAEWMNNYRSQLMGLTAPAGLAGLPQVHLPVLSEAGAPMGVSLLAPAGCDRALLQLAEQLCGATVSTSNVSTSKESR